MRDVAQQQDEAVMGDGAEDEVVGGVVNEDPEGVVDDGADGVGEKDGAPDGEVPGREHSHGDLEADERQGVQRGAAVGAKQAGDLRVRLEDLRAALPVRVLDALCGGDDGLRLLGRQQVAARARLRDGLLRALAHRVEAVPWRAGWPGSSAGARAGDGRRRGARRARRGLRRRRKWGGSSAGVAPGGACCASYYWRGFSCARIRAAWRDSGGRRPAGARCPRGGKRAVCWRYL